jgi:hypothetical protein
MKRLLIISLACLSAMGATYYVDPAAIDANNGTTSGTAFKHCPGDSLATGTAARTTLAAGDTKASRQFHGSSFASSARGLVTTIYGEDASYPQVMKVTCVTSTLWIIEFVSTGTVTFS